MRKKTSSASRRVAPASPERLTVPAAGALRLDQGFHPGSAFAIRSCLCETLRKADSCVLTRPARLLHRRSHSGPAAVPRSFVSDVPGCSAAHKSQASTSRRDPLVPDQKGYTRWSSRSGSTSSPAPSTEHKASWRRRARCRSWPASSSKLPKAKGAGGCGLRVRPGDRMTGTHPAEVNLRGVALKHKELYDIVRTLPEKPACSAARRTTG